MKSESSAGLDPAEDFLFELAYLPASTAKNPTAAITANTFGHWFILLLLNVPNPAQARVTKNLSSLHAK
jgi:hypothetical protein